MRTSLKLRHTGSPGRGTRSAYSSGSGRTLLTGRDPPSSGSLGQALEVRKVALDAAELPCRLLAARWGARPGDGDRLGVAGVGAVRRQQALGQTVQAAGGEVRVVAVGSHALVVAGLALLRERGQRPQVVDLLAVQAGGGGLAGGRGV